MRPGGPFELSLTGAARGLGAVEVPGFDSFIIRLNAFTLTFSFRPEVATLLVEGFLVPLGMAGLG